MDSTVRGGLRPTTNRDHLTTPPNGTKKHGTSPAARPDAPPCPPPAKSDHTQRTRPTKEDRWIEAKLAVDTSLNEEVVTTANRPP